MQKRARPVFTKALFTLYFSTYFVKSPTSSGKSPEKVPEVYRTSYKYYEYDRNTQGCAFKKMLTLGGGWGNCALVCAHTPMHSQSHTHVRTHKYTSTHNLSHSYSHSYSGHTRGSKHTQHKHAQIYRQMETHKHTHTNTHSDTHTHTQKTNTHKPSHTHTYTDTDTETNTNKKISTWQ